jgi:hypothetical protein
MHSSPTYFPLNTHWPYFRQIIEVFASLSSEQKTEVWEEVIAGLPERQRQMFSKMVLEDKMHLLQNESSQVHVSHLFAVIYAPPFRGGVPTALEGVLGKVAHPAFRNIYMYT